MLDAVGGVGDRDAADSGEPCGVGGGEHGDAQTGSHQPGHEVGVGDLKGHGALQARRSKGPVGLDATGGAGRKVDELFRRDVCQLNSRRGCRVVIPGQQHCQGITSEYLAADTGDLDAFSETQDGDIEHAVSDLVG
jgi:hypothetical protein